jgi:hypothetical protein
MLSITCLYHTLKSLSIYFMEIDEIELEEPKFHKGTYFQV